MSQTAIETILSYVPRMAQRRLISFGGGSPRPVSDDLEAAVLLVDVSGFTKLTETLAKRGPDGAEEMTRALNSYFGELIEWVHIHGGDIVKFAGDAMLVLWARTGDDHLSLADMTQVASQCAVLMQKECGLVEPIPGVQLRFKALIGAGKMRSVLIGGVRGGWEFVVMGDPLVEMGDAADQARAGDVILTPAAWRHIGASAEGTLAVAEGDAISEGCVRLRQVLSRSDLVVDVGPLPPLESEATLATFLPGAVRARLDAGQMSWLAELRQLTILFVNLPGLSHEAPLEVAQTVMEALQTAVFRLEGSINKLSIDEKGISMVAAMGLPPLSHYDDPARGVGAAVAIHQSLAEMHLKCAIGVTTGRAFCGEVGNARRREYTMMGDVVNLAARLMGAAKEHGILVDSTTYQAAEKVFDFEALPTITLKGKTGQFSIFKPIGKASKRSKVELVGRADERKAINQQLDNLVARHECGTLLLHGEAGIGKSSLVSYAAAMASSLNIKCLQGLGLEVEQSTPYVAWQSLLGQLLAIDESTKSSHRRERVLARLAQDPDLLVRAPLLGAIFPLDIPDNDFTAPLEGATRARMTQELVARLLQDEAKKCPLLLILDDCHWLDSASWALAQVVAKRVRPAVVLLASRPLGETLPPEVTTVLGENGVSIALTPMSPEEALELVSHRLGVTSLPGPIAEIIQERAGGHPLFIEELGYALRDSGYLIVENETCRLAPHAKDLRKLDLPTTVQGTIMSRIDRLRPSEQLTLKLASVIGREFDHRILSGIHPIEADRAEVPRHLATLIEHELIREVDGQQIFKTATTREVTYNLMLFSQRKSIHRSVAEVYEADHADDLSPYYPFLGYQWSSADVAEKAVVYLERAGEAAERNYAYKEAADLLVKALEFDEKLGRESSPRRRLQIHQWLGQVFKGSGRQAESHQHLELALSLARQHGDIKTEANVLVSIAHLHTMPGDNDKALEVFKLAEARAIEAGDGATLVRSRGHHVRIYFRMGEPEKAIALSQETLETAKNWPGGPVDASVIQGFLGILYVTSDVPGLDFAERMRRGVSFLEEAVAVQRRKSDRLNLINGLNLLGNAQWGLGKYQEATRTFEETLALTTDMGIKYDEICTLINLAIQAHDLGDFDRMRSYSQRAHVEAAASQYRDYDLCSQVLLSLALFYVGKVGDGQRMLQMMLRGFEDLPEATRYALEGTILPYVAEAHYFAGDTDLALEAMERAWRLVEDTGVREYEQPLLTMRGEAYLGLGRLEEAEVCFLRAIELGKAIGVGASVGRGKLGMARLAIGKTQNGVAVSFLEEAYENATGAGTACLAGEICLELGRLALEAGSSQKAAHWFETALTWSGRASCPSLEALAQSALATVCEPEEAVVHRKAARDNVLRQIAGLDSAAAQRYLGMFGRSETLPIPDEGSPSDKRRFLVSDLGA